MQIANTSTSTAAPAGKASLRRAIRYTSMSVPYHLGTGWFGGFLPLIATVVTTSAWAKASFGAGALYLGLVYPVVVCLITVVVGGLFIRETQAHRLDSDAHPMDD